MAGLCCGDCLHQAWMLLVMLLENAMHALCIDGTGNDSNGEDDFAGGQHYCCFVCVDSLVVFGYSIISRFV